MMTLTPPEKTSKAPISGGRPSLGSGNASLIGGHLGNRHRRIDRRAAQLQGMRLGQPAVVSQWAEDRIDTDQIRGINAIRGSLGEQVVPQRIETSGDSVNRRVIEKA